ncbi:MAG TPA: DUF411 domain-containing protein [Gemmatimonadaceae bacterium]|nr:DUF411 domain-containing protein [Gemmatimonadaceae bacterium]
MNDPVMTRRAWMATVARTFGTGAALSALLPLASHASPTSAPVPITVYKDPSCGCCAKWIEHLRSAGLRPAVHDRSDMDALKDSLGVPAALRSCHTAVAGRYVIEGHVPAADVKRFVAAAPKGIVGIAVPGMPAGSPGMEVPGRADRYDVIAFAADGTTKLYAHH